MAEDLQVQINELKSRIRILEMLLYTSIEVSGFADEKAKREFEALSQVLLPPDSRRVPNVPQEVYPNLRNFIEANRLFVDEFTIPQSP